MAAFILTSCATYEPTVYPYSWGSITRMSKNDLARICTPSSAKWDDGTYRPRHAPVLGCVFTATGEIYVEDSCRGARAIVHELAHVDGHSDPREDGYDWDE